MSKLSDGRIQRDGRVQDSKQWLLKCKGRASSLIWTPQRLCQDLSKLRVCLALQFWIRSSSTVNAIFPSMFLPWMQTQTQTWVMGNPCLLCLCSSRQTCWGVQGGGVWVHLSLFCFSAGFRFGGGIFFNQQNYFPWNHKFFYHDFLGKYYSAHVMRVWGCIMRWMW